MKRSAVFLAIVLFAGVAHLASAANVRVLRSTTATATLDCSSNTAFDYTSWRFRRGFKAVCCQQCSAGSMNKVCLNAYDRKGAKYYACGSPESYSPCLDVNAPIPPKPICPEDLPGYTSSNSLPELQTRDLCKSNIAFDYGVWKFRAGFKALCCSYCASGSMEPVCLNAYDKDGKKYYACGADESPRPCENPNAPIPTQPVTPSKPVTPVYTADNSLPELETRDLCKSNIAFDYGVWKFRTGYKALCCSYCASGSMEPVCLNAYDKNGKKYYACGADESPAPCTKPNAPIPTQPICN